MSIRSRVFLAQAAVCVGVIFQAGLAGAVSAAVPANSPPPVARIAAPGIVATPPAPVRPVANPYAGVTKEQLLPQGVVGEQQYFEPNNEQWDNARTIVNVVRDRGLPAYSAVISLATALQESLLRNLTVAVDYDSLGVFQQRPSQGWGDPAQLTDLRYATGAFLDEMMVRAPTYAEVPLWEAAQAVQRSGFPTLYDQWAEQAARMVQKLIEPPREFSTEPAGSAPKGSGARAEVGRERTWWERWATPTMLECC